MTETEKSFIFEAWRLQCAIVKDVPAPIKMTRRVAFRLLLSLVLLLSQHMALAHAISHWAAAGSTPASAVAGQDADYDLSRAVAGDPSCAKCLAFAHLGCAPRCDDYVFAPAVDRHAPLATRACAAPATSCIRAFNPRAPPFPA